MSETRRSGFGDPQTDEQTSPKVSKRKPSPQVRKQTSQKVSSSVPTVKITFKLPQSTLDDFEDLYEKLRAEERTHKRKLTKVAFAGHAFRFGLDETRIRKALSTE